MRSQAQHSDRVQGGVVVGREADDAHLSAPQLGLAMEESDPSNAGLSQTLDLRYVKLDTAPGLQFGSHRSLHLPRYAIVQRTLET